MRRPIAGPHPEAVARTTDEARAGRSELDLRLLADPERGRRLTIEMLERGGEEAERYFTLAFERAYAAYSRRDWELNTLMMHPDHAFRMGTPGALPDAEHAYHGVAGYFEAQDLLHESWSATRIALDELAVRDRESIVSIASFSGKGARSGLAFEWETINDNQFRDGLVVSQTFWWDRREAERDLGLELPARDRGA